MWEDVSAGTEPGADQVSEPEPDLSLAKYLRSTGIREAPNIKGTVQKEQRETITSLEVEEVTFSAVYDYYKNQQELTRPFSPESEIVRVEKVGDKCVLEITNIQKGDEGQYLCHAVNIVGEAKSIAQVEILPEDGRSLALPPPVTHQHVIQFDLEENTSSRSPSPQEILLEVELDENEVKEFEKQVKIITSPEFSPDKKSMVVSLDVLPLALLEQVSGFGSEENEDVKIDFQVTEMPPRFAVPFTDVKVTEGSEAVFECAVTGTPVPVVQWFRGDTCVTPVAGKYVVSQKEGLHSLMVLNVGPSDSGWYRCRAVNRLGEAVCKGSVIVTGSDLQGASAMASSETDVGSEPERPEKCDLLLSKAETSEKWSEVEVECEFKPHAEDSGKLVQLPEMTEQLVYTFRTEVYFRLLPSSLFILVKIFQLTFIYAGIVCFV
uniref:Ig-like domain-containing protein n=1 Tax=Phasianus colchicus TaxID=9054 RepID=A0A669QB70_PHACC